MKMALSDFSLRKKGIYGILHVIILLLSLFLVISISIDSVGIYESPVVDLCLVPVRLYSRIVSFEKQMALSQYTLHFPAGGDTLPEYYIVYGMDFLSRSDLYDSFRSLSTGGVCDGHCGRLAHL